MRKLGANQRLIIQIKASSRGVTFWNINFAKGASRTCKNFGKVYTPKSETSELSKGIGKVRKREGRIFDEKRV